MLFFERCFFVGALTLILSPTLYPSARVVYEVVRKAEATVVGLIAVARLEDLGGLVTGGSKWNVLRFSRNVLRFSRSGEKCERNVVWIGESLLSVFFQAACCQAASMSPLAAECCKHVVFDVEEQW